MGKYGATNYKFFHNIYNVKFNNILFSGTFGNIAWNQYSMYAINCSFNNCIVHSGGIACAYNVRSITNCDGVSVVASNPTFPYISNSKNVILMCVLSPTFDKKIEGSDVTLYFVNLVTVLGNFEAVNSNIIHASPYNAEIIINNLFQLIGGSYTISSSADIVHNNGLSLIGVLLDGLIVKDNNVTIDNCRDPEDTIYVDLTAKRTILTNNRTLKEIEANATTEMANNLPILDDYVI